jgi:hypothetical protein
LYGKGAGRMSELPRLKTAPPAPAVSASAGVFSVPGLGQGRIYVGLNPVEARAKFDRLRQAACFDIAVNRRPAAPADLCLQVGVRSMRIVGMVREALGGRDPVLVDLTREDVRNVRDHMLDRLKTDGTKISPSSVTRDLNNLRAIINFSATEIPLPATFQNPFNKLSVKSIRGQTSERGKRDPRPPAILKAARERIAVSARQPLLLIWRLLEGTGCRLAEITGLRVEDLDVSSDLPHVRIAWHEDRRIKTDASARSVPLTGDALEAAKEAIKAADWGHLLFPDYGRPRGGLTRPLRR